MSRLDPRIHESLHTALTAVARRGGLLSPDRLKECYATFRDRFGPSRLKSLDGGALLQSMHMHGNRESLVYWLEFKNDEEFPGPRFGSISGGSAHKFGLFRRKHTAQWVRGNAQNEENITEAEAMLMARKHRDQLLAGVALLEKLPADADDDQYRNLQEQLTQVAPDVSGPAWGHKYFSLLFPDKLDDYHNHRWQRFNLIRLLQLPPASEGLYVCAGRFVKIAGELGWPMNHLTAALNERHGRPHSYWRLGTKLNGDQNVWPDMLAGGYAAVGWAALGDVTSTFTIDDPRERIAAAIEKECNCDAKVASRAAAEIRNFVWFMAENDIVLAADGERVLGVGRLKGTYRFEPTPPGDAPHRRDVEWLSTAEWKLPLNEGLQTTVWALRKDERNLLGVEDLLLKLPGPPVPETPEKPVRTVAQLDGIPRRVQAILERKGQAILHGPPGTGKTYWARKAALDVAALASFGCRFDDLAPDQAVAVTGNASVGGLVRFCTFHPAYGYEDFIEGCRPQQGTGGKVTFDRRDGIFKRLCRDAAANPGRKFILLIDEINRGDIPRIFGELLTLLEKDKRGLEVTLPVSGELFSVPQNVFVIGTMSTADRSATWLDTALRRRFGFVELMPDSSALAGAIAGDALPLGLWLDALNARLREHIGRKARNLQVGHAYLLDDAGKPVTDFARFTCIVAEDIIPLLVEYCHEDYDLLAEILGAGMVDVPGQRVREELFSPARRQDFIQALLAPTPELSTSLEAVVPPASARESHEETDDPAR